MTRYLVLLRGINVGGRNKVSMAALRELLESHGHTKVSTHIASGSVILSSDHRRARPVPDGDQGQPAHTSARIRGLHRFQRSQGTLQ
jgi:hypothetical protein